jgi:hypothetical protein
MSLSWNDNNILNFTLGSVTIFAKNDIPLKGGIWESYKSITHINGLLATFTLKAYPKSQF